MDPLIPHYPWYIVVGLIAGVIAALAGLVSIAFDVFQPTGKPISRRAWIVYAFMITAWWWLPWLLYLLSFASLPPMPPAKPPPAVERV